LIDSAVLTLPNPQSTITALCVLSLNLNGEEKTFIGMSHKSSFTQNGSFGLYSIADKKIIAETEVGINPQMIKAFRNLLGEVEFALLCEGTFGGKNSKLYRLLPTPNSGLPFKAEFYDLGDTGNYFIIQDQLALTVMNGSHEIIPFNLATNTVLPGYPTGTSGYDGPREIALDTITNRVFVSTYASDIRIGSYISGNVLGILEPMGKPEGLAIIDGKLWACNAYKKGEYAPDSTIAQFDIGLTSVQEKADSRISITLKQGMCTIISEENFTNADIRVIDAHGKVVVSRAMSGHYLQFSMQDFPQGLYGIHVNAAKTTMNELLLHLQ
jgi:DNA-binding beta-propeller fold protein YncE